MNEHIILSGGLLSGVTLPLHSQETHKYAGSAEGKSLIFTPC